MVTRNLNQIDTIGTAGGLLTITGTGGLVLPGGTTAQRPSTAAGTIRYNSSLVALEFWTGSVWLQISPVVPPVTINLPSVIERQTTANPVDFLTLRRSQDSGGFPANILTGDEYATITVQGYRISTLSTTPPWTTVSKLRWTADTNETIDDSWSPVKFELLTSTPTSTATATATQSGGVILQSNVTVTNPGGPYSSVPNVTITGAAPGIGQPLTVPATAQAVISNGQVIAITIIAGGSNYYSPVVVNIDPPTPNNQLMTMVSASARGHFQYNGSGNQGMHFHKAQLFYFATNMSIPTTIESWTYDIQGGYPLSLNAGAAILDYWMIGNSGSRAGQIILAYDPGLLGNLPWDENLILGTDPGITFTFTQTVPGTIVWSYTSTGVLNQVKMKYNLRFW